MFARDAFACRGCGFAPLSTVPAGTSMFRCAGRSGPERAEEELDAHHITDRNEMPHGGYVAENGISLCETCHAKAEAFHCGDPVPPGFSPAELYALIDSSEEEARACSKRMKDE